MAQTVNAEVWKLRDDYVNGDFYYRGFIFLAVCAAVTMAVPNTGGAEADLDTSPWMLHNSSSSHL